MSIYNRFLRPVLLISSIILLQSSLSAQVINKMSGMNYEYQGDVFKYQDMGPVFEQNEMAHAYYLKANKKLKTGKTWGYVSLGSLGLGIIAIAAEGDCDFIFGSDSCAVGIFGALSAILVFPITGITAIIIRSSGRRNMRKSLDVFNQAFDTGLPEENQVALHFVVNNGIGLQLSF